MHKGVYVGLATGKTLLLVVAIILLALAGRTFNAGAQTETNLYSFGSRPHDGLHSNAGLVQGSDGNFYGTTYGGGTNGDGTVFRISPGGTYTSLYAFAGPPNDGSEPQAGLVQGSDGNLYGTTVGGTGTNLNPDCACLGYGTVFRISPSGSETVLHSFGGPRSDGDQPYGLVQGSDGNFYGTTLYGGASGSGTVFRISSSGSYSNLYSFGSRPNDGRLPADGLVQGSDGNLYGTTEVGGTSTNYDSYCGCYGYGTVFRISPSGSETNLYSFGGSPDGSPAGPLVQGSDGNFYGLAGPGTYGVGAVFRISPSGNKTNLYSFGGSPDAVGPNGLVQGSDGNFYGLAVGGGTYGQGSVFRISPAGSETILYSFGSFPTDARQPLAGLVQGSDGKFYGTTQQGGTYGEGAVVKLSVSLNPPPNQISAVQVSGNNVAISIPSVAYETYQLQFSGSMQPTNWVNVAGVSVTNSIGAMLTLTNYGGAVGPQGFYRFDITP